MLQFMQRNPGRNFNRLPFFLGVVLAAFGLVSSKAIAETTIALSYDSVMYMVRPEQRSISVHHNLQIVFTGQNVVENRDRNTRDLQDRNATAQDSESTSPEGTYVSWRVESSTRLVRTQRDPQSTRIMTVTLTPGNACHLDVVDTLNPGFTEYAFLRISSHTMGYFSSYRVVQTSCTMR
jgi:hypothetical protein